jgi:large subunit ribosomal protein L23
MSEKMNQALRTIRHPLITEKSTILRDKDGIYCFRVRLDANKIEIARAVEQVFAKDKVKVADVRTSRVQGKRRRMGRFEGRRSDWKKAWVKLAPGSGEIEFFEST